MLYRFGGNRLYFPRVDNPRKILECGYGTGEWAVAVAEEYEDCEVSSLSSCMQSGRVKTDPMTGGVLGLVLAAAKCYSLVYAR